MKTLEAQPLARTQYADGSSTYRGLIFTRKDSGIATAQDMKGKTFVFVDKTTTAGWLFPLHFFKENNIDDPFSWLGETYFAGTHEDAILDVAEEQGRHWSGKRHNLLPSCGIRPKDTQSVADIGKFSPSSGKYPTWSAGILMNR